MTRLFPLVVSILLVCLQIGPALGAGKVPCNTPTYTFSPSLPPSATLHNLVVSGGVLVLDTDAGGYLEEGYVDISVLPNDVTARNLLVKAELVNTLFQGDFEGLTSSDILMHVPKDSANYSDPIPGVWFSDASWPKHLPEVVAGGTGSAASIRNQGTLFQFFRVHPGESYRLTFDIDPSGLDSGQAVTVRLSFYTNDPLGTGPTGPFGRLLLRQAKFQDTTKTTETIQIFRTEPGDGPQSEVKLRFRIIDAEDHLIYQGGDGEYPDDVMFNFTRDDVGGPLPVVDPALDTTDAAYIIRSAYTADDIVYAAVELAPNWRGSSSAYAIVDNVRLVREDQVEVVLLDAFDNPIESSTLLTGFRVTERPSTIRVYLRTSIPTETPSVESITICDGFRVDLAAGAEIGNIDQNRLGFTGFISPRLDWNDKTLPDIRTEIVDPSTGVAENALTYLVNHGISRWRNALLASYLNMSYSTSTGLGLCLRDNETDHYHIDGQVLATRYRNLADAGFTILEIIEPDGIIDDSGKYTSTFDDAPTTPSDKASLHIDFTRLVTELCSDGATHMFADGSSVDFPVISNYQVSVETNLGTDDAWYWILFPPVPNYAAHVEQLNDMAAAIQGASPTGATIATSISTTTQGCFAADYFSNLWSSAPAYGLDASLFTYLGINTFSNSVCTPEMFPAAIGDLRTGYLDPSWAGYDLAIGAFSEKRTIYDPGPCFVNGTWDRAYGEDLFAKRVARATLNNLRLPAKEIYYYALFDESWVSGSGCPPGYNLCFDPGWKSGTWTTLLDRVDGTGLLGWGDALETGNFTTATQYIPNRGGIAFLEIGEILSSASPYESSLRKYHLTSPQEYYHHALFKDLDGNWIVALWFFKEYDYATDAGDWLSGAYDSGFLETRLVDLVLPSSLGSVSRATLIPLDGQYAESLRIGTLPSGNSIVDGMAVGEMPVLVKLELEP